jgi:hypothetical protein|tara:strand:+ start:107 stop:466 length:360 start_codon:yes stop_codon:yes gene_type:complete
MKLEVVEPKRIDDGKHEGVITAVEERTKPYHYIDLILEFEGGKKIKAGYPLRKKENKATVSADSKFGKLLLDFGASLEVGTTIDTDTYLVGKECTFMTLTKTSERGMFANVVPGSLKPK